jgi:hypothetical protein
MIAEYNSVYDELAYFLASLSPRKVLQYKASPKAQTRVNELLLKNKGEGLSAEENAEMERYMTLEHIIRLAKSKALQQLNTK